MPDKGKKDKGKREEQKQRKLTVKERRKQKKDAKHNKIDSIKNTDPEYKLWHLQSPVNVRSLQ